MKDLMASKVGNERLQPIDRKVGPRRQDHGLLDEQGDRSKFRCRVIGRVVEEELVLGMREEIQRAGAFHENAGGVFGKANSSKRRAGFLPRRCQSAKSRSATQSAMLWAWPPGR